MRTAQTPPRREHETRRHDSRITKATILRAAERIFAETGLAGARTEAIADSAGINKAMLYYYFKSKQGLYRAVLEANVEEFCRRAEQVLSQEGPAGTLLLNYVGNHFDFLSEHPYYARLFQHLLMTDDKSLARIVETHLAPMSRRVIALIERGVKSGEFHPLDARHTAMSLVALTVFYFHAAPMIRRLGNIDAMDPAQRAHRRKEILRFVRYALFADAEAVTP